MHGNVWEWCQDRAGEVLPESVTDPAGPSWGEDHVCRGGGWNDGAIGCRPDARMAEGNFVHIINPGFRLALSPTH